MIMGCDGVCETLCLIDAIKRDYSTDWLYQESGRLGETEVVNLGTEVQASQLGWRSWVVEKGGDF